MGELSYSMAKLSDGITQPSTSYAKLLNLESFDVFVGFGKLTENASHIDGIVSDNEAASGGVDVAFDVGNAINFGQIAPDRGGTAHSRHVWQFQNHLLAISRSHRSCTFFATLRSIPLAAQNGGQGSNHHTSYPSVHFEPPITNKHHDIGRSFELTPPPLITHYT